MKEIMDLLPLFFRNNGIEIFGTAPVTALESEPSGYRPSDLLLGAQTMICMGLPVPRGLFRSGEKALRLYWRTANIYYRRIDGILLQAANLLEDSGGTAVPVFG